MNTSTRRHAASGPPSSLGLLVTEPEEPRPLRTHRVERAEVGAQRTHDVGGAALREDQVVQRAGVTEAGVADDLDRRSTATASWCSWAAATSWSSVAPADVSSDRPTSKLAAALVCGCVTTSRRNQHGRVRLVTLRDR